jgi:hypothetical protein
MSPSRTSAKRALLGRRGSLILILAAVLISSACVLTGLTAAGFTGVRGTFTVKDCSMDRSTSSSPKGSASRSHEYNCHGIFRSEDGGVLDDKAFVSGLETDHDPGDELSVQHSDNIVAAVANFGEYTVADSNTVTASFVGAFLILSLVAVGLWGLLTGFGEPDSPVSSWKESWRATRGTSTRVIVLATLAVSIGGAVVISPLLGYLLVG